MRGALLRGATPKGAAGRRSGTRMLAMLRMLSHAMGLKGTGCWLAATRPIRSCGCWLVAPGCAQSNSGSGEMGHGALHSLGP